MGISPLGVMKKQFNLSANMTKLEKETLERAIVVLQESGWSKEFAARDRFGDEVSPDSPEAYSFCAYGAILKSSLECTTALSLLDQLSEFVRDTPAGSGYSPVTPLFRFNDITAKSKEEVIQLFVEFLKSESVS